MFSNLLLFCLHAAVLKLILNLLLIKLKQMSLKMLSNNNKTKTFIVNREKNLFFSRNFNSCEIPKSCHLIAENKNAQTINFSKCQLSFVEQIIFTLYVC